MKKPFLVITAAAMLLAGSALAAQTPAPDAQKSPPASGAPAPAPKPKAAASAAGQKKPGATAGAAAAKSAAPALTTQKQKSSYAIGLNIGRGLHRDGVDIDPALLARGLRDALGNAKPLLTDDEVKATLTTLQNDMRKKQELLIAALGEANKKEGEVFLADNKTKEGVVVLPSGLEYKILKQGDGPKPTATDSVVCNYRGTLLNGTEFDSSYKRGQPATFPVTGVIKGWTEALQLMPVGSKWQLFLPSDLAYGPGGAQPGSGIGPNATLIFEVELLSIQPKEAGKETDKK